MLHLTNFALGDVFYYGDDATVYMVTHICNGKVTAAPVTAPYSLDVVEGTADKFRPIPLTKEFLLDSGFIYEREFGCYRYRNFVLEYNDARDTFWVSIGRNQLDIQYTHELQHLFNLIRKDGRGYALNLISLVC